MSLARVTPCSVLRPAAAASSSMRSAQQQHRAAAAAPLLAGWRRQRRRQRQAAVHASEEDLDQQLQADLERLRQRQAAASGGGVPQAASAARQQQQQQAASSGGSPLGGLKDAVDKVLIADFFFILFALAWLGVALGERSALQSTRLLDTWLSLWQWVFQPAIGVLMLGAIVSGAVGWAKDNLGGGQR
ncbi:hypothetical protein C2E21_5655 [Chlorella sorokiniana]|uniref:Uncharacterized protein n=1 Tax=Chlorella sorokiniana TaxID=3076 RepID=A0A2P6TP85_CHLSO|nr:hypothetical protein C2E21_5655 [Chlorella sorokiniana]|eukprot:PRW51142.1 hypothetical protein C2E21_5655 [Chlorella sorokiniana]